MARYRSRAARMVNVSSSRKQRTPWNIIGIRRPRFKVYPWRNKEEEAIMDEQLEKLGTSLPMLKLYGTIALHTPDKSIRDVSMRLKWLIKNGKVDKKNLKRIKNNSQGNVSDPIGQLFRQNAETMEQIASNLRANKINDNTVLMRQIWDNIVKISNGFDNNHGIMKNMPPVPVEINKDLLNSVLPLGMNEDPGNSALRPINVLEDTVVPIMTTHMQPSAVGVEAELSKLSVIPDKIMEEPVNENVTKIVPPEPVEGFDDCDFYVPKDPKDPDYLTYQKMMSSARAVEGCRG